ncbi:hypothetical protein IWZ00DRAFT_83858 [Phyllosticta capitalensis]
MILLFVPTPVYLSMAFLNAPFGRALWSRSPPPSESCGPVSWRTLPPPTPPQDLTATLSRGPFLSWSVSNDLSHTEAHLGLAASFRLLPSWRLGTRDAKE